MPAPPKSNSRDRVLAQWRGIDLGPLETARASRAQTAASLVARLTKDMRLDVRQNEAEIVKVWNSLIDPVIAAHAQPTGVRNGTLCVTVDSNAWHCEIMRYRRKEILEQLQHSFGKTMIKKISFRVG